MKAVLPIRMDVVDFSLGINKIIHFMWIPCNIVTYVAITDPFPENFSH